MLKNLDLPHGYLQLFAGDGLLDFDEDTSDPSGEGDQSVDLDNEVDDEPEDEKPKVSDDEEFTALSDEDYDDEPEEEKPNPEPEPEPEPESEKKPEQTPEENAKFAEQRRQAQLKAELEKSAEFQLAKQLADMYGTTPDQMLEQVREQNLKKKAEKDGVTVEYLKQQQAQNDRIGELEGQIAQQQYTAWQSRINAEAERLKGEFKMLSDQEINEARTHMLQVLKNPDVPLEQVVWSLHGKKILDGTKESLKQETLAEMSGRKGMVPPKGSKAQPTPTLTSEEQYVAKQMGLSDADYLKYKA
jgi:pyruvate/2-oxoglutarate dehydrogenase complex dihydrolipoamide acyltransferase (E2) component